MILHFHKFYRRGFVLCEVWLQYILLSVNVYVCTGYNFTGDSSAPSCTPPPVIMPMRTNVYDRKRLWRSTRWRKSSFSTSNCTVVVYREKPEYVWNRRTLTDTVNVLRFPRLLPPCCNRERIVNSKPLTSVPWSQVPVRLNAPWTRHQHRIRWT